MFSCERWCVWCAGLWNIIGIVSLPSILDMSLLLTPSVWLPLLTCSAQMRWYVWRGGSWCIIWTVSLTTMPNIPAKKWLIDQSMCNCICPSWAVFLVMVMSTHEWSIPHVVHMQIINSLIEDWLAPLSRYLCFTVAEVGTYLPMYSLNICLNFYAAPLIWSLQ